MNATVRKLSSHSPYMPETAEKILSAPVPGAGEDTPAITAMREEAREYLTLRGLPSAKLEGWKFTNILPLVKDYGAVQGRTKVSSNKIEGVQTQGLVSSVRENKWVEELITEPAHYTDPNTDPALWHLSNLFFRDGVSIDVPAGMEVAEPLNITMICDEEDAFYMVHTAVRIGANARITIIEDHCGTGTFWKNRLSHFRLEPGAHLTHVRIQRDSDTAVFTQNTKVAVAKDATYEGVTLYTGARMSRNQVHAVLQEPGATCHLSGINLMRGEQHVDATILIEHRAPHCSSRQNYRSILDDRAHGVFQGKVHVHQPAQKTDGYQLSKAILLSEGAEMDTKPELEIYADDVKCSHGATTGQLDEEPLFYMRSRGIGEDDARSLLIESFAADALETLRDDAVRQQLMGGVREWLKR